MSRRRKGIQRDYIMVRIVCLCGEPLGKVLKQPRAPERLRYLAPKPLEFRDLPDPSATSGKIARRCPECGAEFQRQWSKLRAMLDDMETHGVPVMEIRP